MKLKALKPRLHNVMFHTHTVSGIVISFALFVCFYAGAVALFMDELYQWENPEARINLPNITTIDYDKVVNVVKENVPEFDESIQFGFFPPTEKKPIITFYGGTKDADNTIERFTAYVDPNTYEMDSGLLPKTHMAQTIYELHFFHQIPVVGIYLSGLVAFFFLFAIITGVLTHWKNIVNKFYAFTTVGKWKQIWTNGHISLGFISLPFQIIYAVTGALLGLSILLLAPSAFLMFDGDTNEVLKAVRPDAGFSYEEDAPHLDSGYGFNYAFNTTAKNYDAETIGYMYARNYGQEDGTISVRVDDGKGISGDGVFVYGYKDGSLWESIPPYTRPYSKGAYGVLIKLHYATYGGIFLKIIYFILAMITCYIIISGVMIWRTARDNKKYTDKQRRFHHRVTKVYLAICLSMFPALAMIFIGNKLVPMDMPDRVFYVNSIFFSSWLILTLVGLLWNNYRRLNRNYIFIGSALALLIPLANGIATGDWFWITLTKGQYYVFSVDMTWLLIGCSGLIICLRYLKGQRIKTNESSKKPAFLESNGEEKALVKEEPSPVLQSISKR